MSRPLAFILLSLLSSTQVGALTGPRFWPGFPGWPWGGVGGGADSGDAGAEPDAAGTWGGCPSLSEVDIYRNETGPDGFPKHEWIAGRWYSQPGHVIPELACNGNFKEALKGEGDMRPSGDGEPMGSLLIYPGCKIYIFEEPNFEGDFIEYTGPTIMPDPKYQFGWACGSHNNPMLCPRSYLWSCQQSFPECYPEDGWNTVTYLDNSQSNTETDFKFTQSIGITMGHEESEGGKIDLSIKNALEFDLFVKCSLEITTTTGYNWSNKDTTTWSDQQTYEVSQTVPAGEKVQIQAAVGYCGQNMVETKMFRVVSTRTRKVLEIRNAF